MDHDLLTIPQVIPMPMLSGGSTPMESMPCGCGG